MNALDFLKNMPKEPQLGDSNEGKKLDDTDKKEKKVDFKQQKESILKDLYGISPKKEEKQKKPEEKEQVENLGKLEKKPFFPIIERFQELPGITKLEEGEKNNIYKVIEGKDYDYILENFDNLIKNVEFLNPEINTYLSNYISKIKEMNGIDMGKRKKKKEVKNEEVEIPKVFENYNFLEDKTNDVVQLLAKNYLSFPNGESGKPDTKKDLETIISITANKIIEGKQNLPESVLKLMLTDINNGNIENRFDSLKTLYSYTQTKEGSKGKRASLLFKKIGKEALVKKILALEYNFEKLEYKINNEKTSKEKREKLLKEYENIKNELNDNYNEAGDVFESGKIDKLTENDKGGINEEK